MTTTSTSADLDADRCPKCGERINLEKRPVAWRVGPFNGGWAIYQSEAAANKHADGFRDHAVSVQGLYVRDGT